MCTVTHHNSPQTRGPSVDEHSGPYDHPAIQRVINDVLFKSKNDEGIKWAKYYNPFPTAGFALAVAAVGVVYGVLSISDHRLVSSIVPLMSGLRELAQQLISRERSINRSMSVTHPHSKISATKPRNLDSLASSYKRSTILVGKYSYSKDHQ